MEVNSTVNKPNYNTTKKGAIIGAGLGAAKIGYQLAMVNANYLGLKGADFAAKKERISSLHSNFKTTDLIDMTKTTVSKVVKAAKKAILSPANILKTAGVFALVGAGVGLIVDLYKNGKANKKA